MHVITTDDNIALRRAKAPPPAPLQPSQPPHHPPCCLVCPQASQRAAKRHTRGPCSSPKRLPARSECVGLDTRHSPHSGGTGPARLSGVGRMCQSRWGAAGGPPLQHKERHTVGGTRPPPQQQTLIAYFDLELGRHSLSPTQKIEYWGAWRGECLPTF